MKNNLKSLDEFIEEQYGSIGTKKRNKFENGYEIFISDPLIAKYLDKP